MPWVPWVTFWTLVGDHIGTPAFMLLKEKGYGLTANNTTFGQDFLDFIYYFHSFRLSRITLPARCNKRLMTFIAYA